MKIYGILSMDEIDVIFSNIEVSLFCNAEEICVGNQEI
jgi:hypothetical protein